MDGGMDGWKRDEMDGWIDGRMDGLLNWANRRGCAATERWNDGLMDGCLMDGCSDGVM